MLDTNKLKVTMTSELGNHSYRCLRAVDWEEKYVKRKLGGSGV